MNREIVRDVVGTTVAVKLLPLIKPDHYRDDIDGGMIMFAPGLRVDWRSMDDMAGNRFGSNG